MPTILCKLIHVIGFIAPIAHAQGSIWAIMITAGSDTVYNMLQEHIVLNKHF